MPPTPMPPSHPLLYAALTPLTPFLVHRVFNTLGHWLKHHQIDFDEGTLSSLSRSSFVLPFASSHFLSVASPVNTLPPLHLPPSSSAPLSHTARRSLSVA